ncbi:GTP-binding protein RAD-like [Limulus polyphemus]|uniref:GTP-binding protein RAD-like n=1 Tax=Limulus polyphemus TaxID=6850 RepID=A0ABM1SRL0_LIMPO|nr:GTP-binding protein RAD-like [Limulus polyphemus]
MVLEGDFNYSLFKTAQCGQKLCAAYSCRASDLLKSTHCPGQGESFNTSPSIGFTVPRQSSPRLKTPSQNRLKRNNTVDRPQPMRSSRRPLPLEPNNCFRQRIKSSPADMTLPPDFNFNTRSSSNHSPPLSNDGNDYQRLRNFSLTPKGVINRGDSFRSKSRSIHSVSSVSSLPSRNSTALPTTPVIPPAWLPSTGDSEVPHVFVTESVRHRVLVIGCPEVGKSSLTSQFTTSEYICAYETSLAEENEKSVTIVLNGQESELVFVEHSFVDNMILLTICNFDAYIVVYSVINKRSFQQTKHLLQQIVKYPSNDKKAVILVGNKADLVRLRVVTTDDGRTMATSYGCKFIETSVGINHHVDELLVGLLSQIRLKLQHEETVKKKRQSITLERNKSRSSQLVGGKAKCFIKKILGRSSASWKSCDNLHVL